MMRLKNIALLLTVFLSVDLHAAAITVSEAQGNIVIATESLNFGVAPGVVLHDDFDSGTPGQPLAGWDLSSSAGLLQRPSYSTEASVTGKQSGMSSFLGTNYNSTAEYKNLGGLDTIYLSYYFRADKLSGDPSRNVKLARISGGHNNDTYNQSIGITSFDSNGSGALMQASKDFAESKVQTMWIGDYIGNGWHRAEYYVKLSNPAGTATGTTIGRLNSIPFANLTNVINEETGMKYHWLSMPYYVAHDAGGDYKIYYDNVVVSKNQARVELCDNDIYAECKQPVIAKLENWTAKSITLKKESITPKKPYYFIFDEKNIQLNPKGIYYCLECPSKPTPN